MQYSQTPVHWDPCNLAWWGAEFGSKYHIAPHCRRSKFRYCSPPTDVLTVWHYRVPRALQRPETVTNCCMLPPPLLTETRWFRSPYVGEVSLSVRKQMSYRASLSMQNVSSVFSTNWCTDSVALYGSTTVSDTCKHTSHNTCHPSNKQALYTVS